MKKNNVKLLLENGDIFEGYSFGAEVNKLGELVFNTSVVGYQEIFYDPSYYGQIVTMTYPLIGNYGINEIDKESYKPHIFGLIVKEYCENPSNWKSKSNTSEFLIKNKIPAIEGIDTRKLTRIIRKYGSMKAYIYFDNVSDAEAKKTLENFPGVKDFIKNVSIKEPVIFNVTKPKATIVAIDCGIKYSIIKEFQKNKIKVILCPHTSTWEDIQKHKPEGLFISNGPGDPQDAKETIKLVRDASGKIPIFGICLGHQIIALANGAQTYKLKFGHRGSNHSVKNVNTHKIDITSQNHSYSVEMKDIPKNIEVTHINLLDNTCEGLRIKDQDTYAIQYHPESNPGPNDSKYLFLEFINAMERNKKGDKYA